jgi:FKBP-type peptidyl-prolyl cis-trans isomerase
MIRSIFAALLVVALVGCATGTHYVYTRTGVKVEELVVGTGVRATPAHYVAVHYTGWLEDGTQFDSSYDRGEPMIFPLGIDAVIKGWEEGVAGMKVGGKRRLTVPPKAAYGDKGMGNIIPPGATLIFEVELISVR